MHVQGASSFSWRLPAPGESASRKVLPADFFWLRWFVSVIVTGGTGFIGSNLILERFAEPNEQVVNLGKFTYVESLQSLNGDRYYVFAQGDIPKKLTPLMLVNMLPAKLPSMYGNGQQIRSRFYVKDHCSATRRVLETGPVDQAHDVDGRNDRPNLDIVHRVFAPRDELGAQADGKSYREHIVYATDSPDHNCRYTVDAGKIECELGHHLEFGAYCAWAEKTTQGKLHETQRHRSRRRLRYPALPRYQGGFQATPADLRQAHDLLPAQHLDAGRHSRHPYYLHPARYPAF